MLLICVLLLHGILLCAAPNSVLNTGFTLLTYGNKTGSIIVTYSDRINYPCVRTPLLLATRPCLRGSDSVAMRSALANALNVASTMWWEFLPASCLMCSVMPDVLTTDWKKWSTSCVSNAPIRSDGISKPQPRNGLPDKSCRQLSVEFYRTSHLLLVALPCVLEARSTYIY